MLLNDCTTLGVGPLVTFLFLGLPDTTLSNQPVINLSLSQSDFILCLKCHFLALPTSLDYLIIATTYNLLKTSPNSTYLNV